MKTKLHIALIFTLWLLASNATSADIVLTDDRQELYDTFSRIVWDAPPPSIDLAPPSSEAIEWYWCNIVRATLGDVESLVELDGISSASDSVSYDLVTGKIIAGPLSGTRMRGCRPWLIIYSGEHWEDDAKILGNTEKTVDWVLVTELADGGAFHQAYPRPNGKTIFRFVNRDGDHALVTTNTAIPIPLVLPYLSHSDPELFDRMLKSYGSFAAARGISLLSIDQEQAKLCLGLVKALISESGTKVTAYDPVHGERIRELRSMYEDVVDYPVDNYEGASYDIVNLSKLPGLSFVRIYWPAYPIRSEFYVTESFVIIIAKNPMQRDVHDVVGQELSLRTFGVTTPKLDNLEGTTAYGTKLLGKEPIKREVLTMEIDQGFAIILPRSLSYDELCDLLEGFDGMSK